MTPKIKEELLDELLNTTDSSADLLGPDGLLNQLKKRLIERAMDAELTTELGYDKHSKGAAKANPQPPGAFIPFASLEDSLRLSC